MDGNQANQTDVYIVRGGEALEEWTPQFTYHGFRYVLVQGLPAAVVPTASMLTSHFIHSDVKVIGNIHFHNKSLEILNQIQTAILYTQQSNFHTIPTDCCQREKRGWMGDAQWTSEEASLNLDTNLFYQNFVQTIADTQAVGCTHVTDTVLNEGRRRNVREMSSAHSPISSAHSLVQFKAVNAAGPGTVRILR
jgi:hypothetical protein